MLLLFVTRVETVGMGKGHSQAGRERCILELNVCLRGWCCQEGFNFLDHGMLFWEERLLSRDGIHLSRKEKSIFGFRLANLVSKVRNMDYATVTTGCVLGRHPPDNRPSDLMGHQQGRL